MSQVTIGAYEAKTNFSDLLRQVAEGKSFTITNRGFPVAELKSVEMERREKAREAIAAIKKMRRWDIVLTPEEIKAMIEEGRK